MNKIREKIKSFFRGRYGIDELEKAIVIVGMVLYLAGAVFKSPVLLCFAMAGLLCGLYRAMSRRTWDREKENYIYDRYKKLWKLQYKERKTSRIFMCKKCGRLIRVPKGKGRIHVTCTACGNKSIHRT